MTNTKKPKDSSSTLKQLVAVILAETDNDVINNFFQSEMSDKVNKWDSDEITNFRHELAENKISFKHMDNHGGEGEGEDYWSVYKFTKDTDEVFVQFDGWYQSYNGSEFSEFFFVKPEEVMVTQYFKVQE